MDPVLHLVGTQAGADFSTVVHADSPDRRAAHGGDGRKQIIVVALLGEQPGRAQQAVRVVVAREDIQHASSAAAILPEYEPPRTRFGAPISTFRPNW